MSHRFTVIPFSILALELNVFDMQGLGGGKQRSGITVQIHDNATALQHHAARCVFFCLMVHFSHNKHAEETVSAKGKATNQQKSNKSDCRSIMTSLMFLNVRHHEIDLFFALICSPHTNTFTARATVQNMRQCLFISPPLFSGAR